jgi:hypothetical protein
LFVTCFVLYADIISFTLSHEFSLEVDDNEFFEDMNKLTVAYQLYIELISFTVLVIVIRVIKYTRLSYAIGFMVETLKLAEVDLFYYLVLL